MQGRGVFKAELHVCLTPGRLSATVITSSPSSRSQIEIGQSEVARNSGVKDFPPQKDLRGRLPRLP